jgi:5-methylcytosine-specific restriction endonuclease McrA
MAVSASIRRIVRERAQLRCEYCHADERWQFIRFTIDHILPQSAGGADDVDNLALAFRNCNERRGNRVEGRDPATEQIVLVFNPRQNVWADHFAWDTQA